MATATAVMMVIDLPSGGRIRPDPADGRRAFVTCPGPGGGRPCPSPGERHVAMPRRLETCTGRCPECKNESARLFTGAAPHESGAVRLYDERDPARPRENRRAFVCADRAKPKGDRDPDCIGKDFASFTTMQGSRWRGLCRNCRKKNRRRGAPSS